MTATNHALAGSLIGLSIHNPVAAIVLAITSHFVLDSLPHFGNPRHTSRKFFILLGSDAVGLVLLVGFLALIQPAYWQLAIICGIAAASPDLMWLKGFITEVFKHESRPHKSIITRFHKKIQWGEKPKNWPYEVAWFFGAVIVLAKIV